MNPFAHDDQKMHMPEGYIEPPTSHHGVVLAICIVILALILGALYLWGSELRKREAIAQIPEIVVTERVDEEASDEISAIEADLTAIDLGSIRTDLNTLDAE